MRGRWILAALVLSISGCYEVHEDVWVHPDGSVRYAVDYVVPEYLLGALEVDGGNADSLLARYWEPAATVLDGDSVWSRQYRDGALRHLASEREIGSLERLAGLSVRQAARMDSLARASVARDSLIHVLESDSSAAARGRLDSIMNSENESRDRDPTTTLLGQTTGLYQTSREGASRVRLRHTLRIENTPAPASPGPLSGKGNLAAYRQKAMAGRTYSYRIHAPRIASTNGTLREGGATAEWTFPMAEAVSDTTRTMDAVIDLQSRK